MRPYRSSKRPGGSWRAVRRPVLRSMARNKSRGKLVKAWCGRAWLVVEEELPLHLCWALEVTSAAAILEFSSQVRVTGRAGPVTVRTGGQSRRPICRPTPRWVGAHPPAGLAPFALEERPYACCQRTNDP